MSKPLYIKVGGKIEKISQEEIIRRWMEVNQGEKGVTCPEISEGTGVAYTTVYETLRRWQQRDPPLVEACGFKYQGRGKKPILWRLTDDGTST